MRADPDQELTDVDLIVLRALHTMGPLHGYSLAEAAEIAGCQVGTMKSRIHYALRALRVLLPVARRTPIRGHRRLADERRA